MSKNTPFNMRMSADTRHKLTTLSDISQMDKSAVVRLLIDIAYRKHVARTVKEPGNSTAV